MPKIGDFGTFRDDKGHELPCVVTRVREDGNVDLHIFTTNIQGVEVSLGGPRTVTVIGGVLPIDWGNDVTPGFMSRAPRLGKADWKDKRIVSVLPGAEERSTMTGTLTVVADADQQPIPPEASLAHKPEGE